MWCKPYTICWLVLALGSRALAVDDQDEFFESKIRPILVERCLECHGQDFPESGLRVTSRARILAGGKSGPAAIEGDPAHSLMVEVIGYDADIQMPPDGKLAADEIALLTEWVERGLPWSEESTSLVRSAGEMVVNESDRSHWSFRPISDPPVPTVADSNWPRSSIDSFVLAKLEAVNLWPAPSADRRTLIRRAYYDLTGLPPTYDEVEAFIGDPSPNAFGKVVETLLQSPRYGERWGRHWLDVARYADTKDGVLQYGDARLRPYAYTFRDYVVRAINEDLPFDQFVHQQLSADLIRPPVPSWQLAALGFLTLGRQYDNNVHDVIDDQIDVTTRGFMGLTVACARCHDHKYDPIPTADYYSLYGIMASSEAPAELPTISMDQTPPGRDDFECELYAKRHELNQFVASQHAFLSDVARRRTADYLLKIATERQDPLEKSVFFLSLAPEDLRPSIVLRWRRYLAEHAVANDPVFGIWHDLMQIEASGAEAFAETAQQILAKWSSLPPGMAAGQCSEMVLQAMRRAVLKSRGDVARAYGQLLVAIYDESTRTLAGVHEVANENESLERSQLLAVLTSTASPCYFPLSQTHHHTSRAETDKYWGKLGELDVMAATSPVACPRAMVVYDKAEPIQPRIFLRGNAAQVGRPVPRQFVAIASPSERHPFDQGSGRLELAHAITAPKNPLTARVIVNRVWMYHFGEPLVATPSDFGRRGTPPTNPELLDHLATRFVKEGWSLKRLHRWIMLSRVYQMASSVSETDAAAAMQVDPENRLLWRMNRQRLDFESMRDTLLSVSGRLEQRAGGRPVDIIADPNSTCRTIFGLVDRQSLPGVFRAFDFAAPDQSIERRARTMMPQQALFALNSPFALTQSQSVIARPEISRLTDTRERICAIYRTVLSRAPDENEIAATLAFIEFPAAADSKLSAWEQFAQVLLSSNELMYVD